jgi:hypothetical protein
VRQEVLDLVVVQVVEVLEEEVVVVGKNISLANSEKQTNVCQGQ